jgi:hypothetical protein
MARTHKDTPYTLPFQRSAAFHNHVARERKRKQQQASCTHAHYSLAPSPFGEYAVCMNCDLNLGCVGSPSYHRIIVNRTTH